MVGGRLAFSYNSIVNANISVHIDSAIITPLNTGMAHTQDLVNLPVYTNTVCKSKNKHRK